MLRRIENKKKVSGVETEKCVEACLTFNQLHQNERMCLAPGYAAE